MSTNPTESGETALDPFHRFGIVKRLRNKPLKSFEGSDMWLRLHYAAKMGLITVKMEVPPDQLQVGEMDMDDWMVAGAIARGRQCDGSGQFPWYREAGMGTSELGRKRQAGMGRFSQQDVDCAYEHMLGLNGPFPAFNTMHLVVGSCIAVV